MEEKKKRIMVFGLAGDPPHLGHEEMAKKAIELKYTDQLWFMPCGQHVFEKKMSPRADRLHMVRLVTERLNREHGNHFVCSPMEITRRGPSYMIDTLSELAENFPDAELSLLIGSDQLPNFHKWHDYENLLKNFRVYVYPRPGYELEPWYDGMEKMKGTTLLEAASTAVRGERMRGESEWKMKVSPDIQEFIDRRNLYAATN